MTDWLPRNPIVTMFRNIIAVIDQIVYTLMSYLYQIFFAVASVDFLNGDVVSSIYQRVQLILGVFMIFKLAVSILQGIMSPDAVYDKKGGMGKIITRIIVSLIMLALMAPINVPSPSNEFEKQIDSNGLLFGTLFSLQNRVLSNNTIGRLMIGTSDAAENATSSQSLKQTGDLFATTVLKTFIGVNMKEDGGKVCGNIDSDIMKIYNSPKSTPGQLLSIVSISCEQAANGSGGGSLFSNIIQEFVGSDQYAFAYFLILSTAAGIIIDILLIAYSVDVAVRVFKLAILRLIAPIPIISHMHISAKEGKGADAFSLWTQSLISTYIELFIRLAVIYFVLFILNSILVNGINFTYGTSSTIINGFATLFIIIGLMFFARQAPNYIKSVLGIKSSGSIGLTALTTATANIAAGENPFAGNTIRDRLRSFNDFGHTINEDVAKQHFGDKDFKGRGEFYTKRKAIIGKIQEDYDRDLRQEYYKRGLDIDDYSYNILDDNNNVIGTVSGLDRSNYSKHLFEHKKSVSARTSADVLDRNKKRYSARMNQHAPSDGRGVTARRGDLEQTAAHTTAPQYNYTDSTGTTPRYSDMPRRGSHTPPPDSSKNPPGTP